MPSLPRLHRLLTRATALPCRPSLDHPLQRPAGLVARLLARFLVWLLACTLGVTGPVVHAATPTTTLAATPAATPAAVLAASPASAWRAPSRAATVVMDLAGGQRVVIELATAFAPRHSLQIARLVRAHWYDGLAITRVQDNYVTQWGDADGNKSLPTGMSKTLTAEFSRPSLEGLAFYELPDRDVYARHVGFADSWPVARETDTGPAWLTHCYGMVGAGRDLEADSGGAGELYAVIGHAPRHLDLNITLVGRVLQGIEHLSSLPRGGAALGFYATPAERTGIVVARMLDELPLAEQPRLEVLRTESATYALWLEARRNRRDEWYLHPAGAIDLCNAMPPVRQQP